MLLILLMRDVVWRFAFFVVVRSGHVIDFIEARSAVAVRSL